MPFLRGLIRWCRGRSAYFARFNWFINPSFIASPVIRWTPPLFWLNFAHQSEWIIVLGSLCRILEESCTPINQPLWKTNHFVMRPLSLSRDSKPVFAALTVFRGPVQIIDSGNWLLESVKAWFINRHANYATESSSGSTVFYVSGVDMLCFHYTDSDISRPHSQVQYIHLRPVPGSHGEPSASIQMVQRPTCEGSKRPRHTEPYGTHRKQRGWR